MATSIFMGNFLRSLFQGNRSSWGTDFNKMIPLYKLSHDTIKHFFNVTPSFSRGLKKPCITLLSQHFPLFRIHFSICHIRFIPDYNFYKILITQFLNSTNPLLNTFKAMSIRSVITYKHTMRTSVI